MILNVYFIDDAGRFQVDTVKGSFTFRPSTFGPGRAQLLEFHPPSVKALAADALRAAVLWTVFEPA